MSTKQNFSHETLPSGKIVVRRFGDDDSLLEETQSYGSLEIGIQYDFDAGRKISETYFSKRRMVSRRTYENVRVGYADMPPAEGTVEDFGAGLLREVRTQQRQNKAEAEQRLAESEESRFPRPTATNWLRVIAGEESHLVIFASRDWKTLSRERMLPSGREWLRLFGFDGPPGAAVNVAKGLQVGFEVTGDREAMMRVSKSLLTEVTNYVKHPPEKSYWQGSVRPRRRPRRRPTSAWPSVLPPLIEFLAGLPEPVVKIFNHHR